VPAFYDRDGDGLPPRWLELMRASLRTLAPQFSATRMLREYVAGPYGGR
jgi:glycogen phosphorylase